MSGCNSSIYVYCPFCARTLDTRLEEDRERKYCHECKWTHYPAPHIATAAVITKVDDQYQPCVLMVRRKREPFKDTWMFPAGFLELGEHPEEDTLPRETNEEVGLTITRSSLIKILKSVSDHRSPDHLVFFYHVQVSGNITNNDIDENTDIQWKLVKEDINIGFPHHLVILDQLRSRVIDYFDYDFKI